MLTHPQLHANHVNRIPAQYVEEIDMIHSKLPVRQRKKPKTRRRCEAPRTRAHHLNKTPLAPSLLLVSAQTNSYTLSQSRVSLTTLNGKFSTPLFTVSCPFRTSAFQAYRNRHFFWGPPAIFARIDVSFASSKHVAVCACAAADR